MVLRSSLQVAPQSYQEGHEVMLHTAAKAPDLAGSFTERCVHLKKWVVAWTARMEHNIWRGFIYVYITCRCTCISTYITPHMFCTDAKDEKGYQICSFSGFCSPQPARNRRQTSGVFEVRLFGQTAS